MPFAQPPLAFHVFGALAEFEQKVIRERRCGQGSPRRNDLNFLSMSIELVLPHEDIRSAMINKTNF